jgi:hypothetical protein
MTHTITTCRIALAEWAKLRTLPSTWRTAVITVAMAIGFGVAVAYSQMSQWHVSGTITVLPPGTLSVSSGKVSPGCRKGMGRLLIGIR